MTALRELAELPHPQLIAEQDRLLDKAYRGFLSRCKTHLCRKELVFRPIVTGVLVIGEAGNAPLLHLEEEVRAVTFPIKHHGKPMQERVCLELIGSWLVRHILFKARNDHFEMLGKGSPAR